MTITLPLSSRSSDVRKRLSRASAEVQTSQLQAITGTPCEVPVPKKVIFTIPVAFALIADEMQFVYHQANYNPFQGRETVRSAKVFCSQVPRTCSLQLFCCFAAGRPRF